MAEGQKIVGRFVYKGLGFPVVMHDVPLRKYAGEWCLDVDLTAVADRVAEVLVRDDRPLSGNQIRFLRMYGTLTVRQLADAMKVSHVAVVKWEKSGDDPAPISGGSAVVLRLFFALGLVAGATDFRELAQRIYTASGKNSVLQPELSLA